MLHPYVHFQQGNTSLLHEFPGQESTNLSSKSKIKNQIEKFERGRTK